MKKIIKGFNAEPHLFKHKEKIYLVSTKYEYTDGLSLFEYINDSWKYVCMLNLETNKFLKGVQSEGGYSTPRIIYIDNFFYLTVTIIKKWKTPVYSGSENRIETSYIDSETLVYRSKSLEGYWELFNKIEGVRQDAMITVVNEEIVMLYSMKLPSIKNETITKIYVQSFDIHKGELYGSPTLLLESGSDKKLYSPTLCGSELLLVENQKDIDYLTVYKVGKHFRVTDKKIINSYKYQTFNSYLMATVVNIGNEKLSVFNKHDEENDFLERQLYMSKYTNDYEEISMQYIQPICIDNISRPLSLRGISTDLVNIKEDLIILKGKHSISSQFDQSAVFYNITEDMFEFRVKLHSEPINIQQLAGLIVRYNEISQIYFYHTFDDVSKKYTLNILKLDNGIISFPIKEKIIYELPVVYLSIEKKGGKLSFKYSLNNDEWHEIYVTTIDMFNNVWPYKKGSVMFGIQATDISGQFLESKFTNIEVIKEIGGR